MPLCWNVSKRRYCATIFDEVGEKRFRLIVEPVGNRWGWTVLGLGITPRYGDADTLQEAMRDAEQTAQ